MKTRILAITFLKSLLLFSHFLSAAPGDVDLSFDAGSGIDGEVKAMALQSDGKLIIGGRFTTVKGLQRQSIARLNPDGSGDPTFDAGTNADQYISAIAIQSDGKVLFTRGNFPNWTDHKVTRLNTDGSVDTSFVPDVGNFPSAFSCMALQPDGKIVLGGFSREIDEFGNLGSRSLLMRLNANGSLDNSFANADGTFDGPSEGFISCLALQPDGKILIGGSIVALVNGTYHYDLLRLNSNGTVDTNFNALGGIIHAVGLQSDGKILLAGYGIGVNTNWNGVMRYNADGSLDGTFHPGIDNNSSLGSFVVQPDGKIICTGSYMYVNGTNRNGLVRLASNGSLDTSFNPGTDVPNNDVAAIVLQPDGRIFIGGGFTLVNATNRERVARLNSDGSLDPNFKPGSNIDAGVNSLALQSDGKIILGGSFVRAGGAARNCVARLNGNGSLDTSFDPGAGPSGPYNSFNVSVSVVALQPDGKILVGGDFRAINGMSRNRLVRLNADGTVDTSFVPWVGAPLANYSFQPFQLVVQPDGKILVGGNAALASNSDGSGLARLNANGSFDTTFHADTITTGGGDYAVINSLALQPDGKIVVGGYFVQSDAAYYLMTRLNANGSRDTSFAEARGGGVVIITSALQTDGKILVASGWSDIGGWIARLNSNGTVDNTFNGGSGADNLITSFLIQPNGKILIAGLFSRFNGTNCNHIARLNANGSLDTNFNAGAGAVSIVNTTALQPDGNVLVAGDVITASGAVRLRIARLLGDAVTPSLTIARSNASFIVSWPVSTITFQLEERTNLALSNSWFPVAQPRVTNSGRISVTVPMSTGSKFFHLKSQ